MAFKAIICPFSEPPFPLHFSPFLTREKANSYSRRTIMDLRGPKVQSVNYGVKRMSYLGIKFQQQYPSIDHIVRQVNALGPLARIFKLDTSRAFRHITIDPGDIELLGLHHRQDIFIDLLLLFTFHLGSFVLRN